MFNDVTNVSEYDFIAAPVTIENYIYLLPSTCEKLAECKDFIHATVRSFDFEDILDRINTFTKSDFTEKQLYLKILGLKYKVSDIKFKDKDTTKQNISKALKESRNSKKQTSILSSSMLDIDVDKTSGAVSQFSNEIDLWYTEEKSCNDMCVLLIDKYDYFTSPQNVASYLERTSRKPSLKDPGVLRKHEKYQKALFLHNLDLQAQGKEPNQYKDVINKTLQARFAAELANNPTANKRINENKSTRLSINVSDEALDIFVNKPHIYKELQTISQKSKEILSILITKLERITLEHDNVVQDTFNESVKVENTTALQTRSADIAKISKYIAFFNTYNQS